MHHDQALGCTIISRHIRACVSALLRTVVARVRRVIDIYYKVTKRLSMMRPVHRTRTRGPNATTVYDTRDSVNIL